MADKWDRLIRDYVTGRLDAKINIRRLELSARTPSENIGASRVRNTTSPQEILIIKFDEDELLRQLEYQKAVISEWWKTIDGDTQNIVIYRYSSRMLWWQIAQELYINERTARRRYSEFKDEIRAWSG
jgi:RinA family phage transcriptional activator